jgi:hypothetical protein
MPVFDPKVPAAGAAGGARATDTTGFGDAFNSGIDGLNGETGGGGTGQAISIPYPDPTITGIAGAGAAGTCFSGGSASGGAYAALSATAGRYGSAGSAGAAGKDVDGFDLSGAFGGAGNPGGAGIREGTAGNDGTGGTLIIICEGALSGTGSVTAKGSNGKYGTIPGVGGASGGGSITVMYGTNPSSAVSLSAAGGLAADDGNFNMGGRGGDGSARKIAIGSN